MLKLVMMPPQNDLHRQWASRLQRSLPDYRVVVPETEAEARQDLIDADAAYGWIPPDLLPIATKLRWLQNPQAGPAPGYYYPALIAHPYIYGSVSGTVGYCTSRSSGMPNSPRSGHLLDPVLRCGTIDIILLLSVSLPCDWGRDT